MRIGQYVKIMKMNNFQKEMDEQQKSFAIFLQQPEKFGSYLEEKKYMESRENESVRTHFIRGFCGVLGAFVLHLLIGAIYRWPMINLYVTSYYKITNDPYLEANENSIGTPIFMLSVGLTMKLGIKLCKKLGKMMVVCTTIIMLVLSLQLSCQMPSFLLFVLCHNMLYGMFAGLLFLTTLGEAQKYFSQYSLIVNSIILVGTGLGGALFGHLNILCMNPKQFLPNGTGYFAALQENIAYSMPGCIEEMSYIVGGMGVIGCLLVWRMFRYNDANQTMDYYTHSVHFQFTCQSEEQALKSGVFWKIILVVLLSSGGNFFMAMNYNKIASPQITEEKFLQSVVLVNGVSNGLFRFVWGAFFKQFGFKYVFLIAMSLNIISFSLMEWSYLAKESYMIMHGISGAILGGLMVMVPNLCLLVFGDRIGNKIYSYYWGAFTFSNFLQYLVGVYFGESYGWVGLFKIFLIQSTLGLLFGLSVTYQGRWENSLQKLTF